MGALVDALFQATDPIVAILLVGILAYMRMIRKDLKNELAIIRGRVARLEESHLEGPAEEPAD